MVYYTPCFDKRLKNRSENSNEKFEKIRKTQFRDLVNSKLLLNRSELEKIIYMKKMRGDDTFPTVYLMLHSDERFRKQRQKTLAAIRCEPHDFRNCS